MDCILQQFHARAAAAGVCKPELDAISACGTWKRALAHRRAPFWAYWYACRVVKGPWPPGEEEIAKDAGWAYDYACMVVRGPWRGHNI